MNHPAFRHFAIRLLEKKSIETGVLLCLFVCAGSGAFAAKHGALLPSRSELGEKRRQALYPRFLERMAEDRKRFSASLLNQLESEYQVANVNSRSARARRNLENVVTKPEYEGANRVGCALVYLGYLSDDPAEKERYLKRAIREYGDSWYGSAVQVGPYARYLLGKLYLRQGLDEKAKTLFDEIRTLFPESIDHEGRLLVKLIP